jgi:hypothetical protein
MHESSARGVLVSAVVHNFPVDNDSHNPLLLNGNRPRHMPRHP